MWIHSDTATYVNHIYDHICTEREHSQATGFKNVFYVQIVAGQNMRNKYSTRTLRCQDVDLALHINAQLGNQCFDTYLDRPNSIVICCGTHTSTPFCQFCLHLHS